MLQTDQEIFDLIGDPHVIARQIKAYTRSAQWLSSQYSQLADQYDQQWIAVFNCEVRAVSDSLDEVLQAVDDAGLLRGEVLTRFVEKHPRKFIL